MAGSPLQFSSFYSMSHDLSKRNGLLARSRGQ
jgi:hypothetical protein